MKLIRTPLFLLLFFSPLFGWSQSFSAHANKTKVAIGENLTLHLELEDPSTQDTPDFSEISKNFQIVGQQSSSVTKIINGSSSSSRTWDLTLTPLQSGQQMILPATIETQSGILQTQAIAIDVVPENPAREISSAKRSGLSLTARINKTSLYKNQPVLVHFELALGTSARNIQFGDFSVKNAIVERQGDPQVHKRWVQGKEQQTVDMSYLVTPMKEGILDLPSLTVQAEVAALRPQVKARALNSFSDDEDGGDPFAQMQNQMQNIMSNFMGNTGAFDDFNSLRPVAVHSQPIHVKVIAPIIGMNPWLPAENLALSESWSGVAKVGEPLSLKIITQARGLASSQLPGFEDQLISNSNYKVYSEQPEKSMTVARGEIESARTDSFTVVPQKSGDLRLPAIKLAWWDTVTQQRREALLPEKIFHVLPGIAPLITAPAPLANVPARVQSSTAGSVTPRFLARSQTQWFAFLFGILLIGYLIFHFYHKSAAILRSSPPKQKIKEVIVVPLNRKDLNNCKNLNEVRQFLQKYSHEQWATDPYASLAKIFSVAKLNLQKVDGQEYSALLKTMEEALYAQTPVEIDVLKAQIPKLFFASQPRSKKTTTPSFLPDLNPT
jgi:hypothetical protein